MHAIARRVVRTIRTRRLLAPGDRVAVAISGGSDSVALAWILREVETQAGGIAVAGLIHVNHGLRGGESDADEAFCLALAGRAGWPIEVARVNVRAIARERHLSIEAAARLAREHVFVELAPRLGATVVATGHTLDDQAETVLLRLLRGAGTRGLSGIRGRRGNVIRPLLDCRRQDLRRYLAARAEPFREDSSNRDVTIPRNRIRHEVLPVLEAVAPGAQAALARLAAHAADDEEFLRAAAIELRPKIVLSEGGPANRPASTGLVAATARGLAELPAGLARRLVRQLASEVAPDVTLSARQLDAVCTLARADSVRGHLDLTRLTVERQGDRLTFAGSTGQNRVGRGPRSQAANPECGKRVLAVPGAVELPEAGVTITAASGAGRGVENAGRDVALLQAASVTTPLAVRYWQPGDRFRPLGAPGRRKVQDVFVDRKVPRARRHLVPIVVDTHDHILWVAGVAMAEECRVTAPEAGVVILEMRKP
jgi:tRNA(Ile)-lysidine synthase